jgi:hypothetical protein
MPLENRMKSFKNEIWFGTGQSVRIGIEDKVIHRYVWDLIWINARIRVRRTNIPLIRGVRRIVTLNITNEII